MPLYQQAAVDAQHLTSDVRGFGAGQERHRVGDVIGVTDARERDLLEQLGASRLGEVLGGHVGVDEAGRHRVDGDAAPRQLLGQRGGEADEAGLRRGVRGLAGVAVLADDRRDVDDATGVLGAQEQDGRGPRAVERAAEVDLQRALPLVVLVAEEQAVDGDAGVVDQDVEAAVVLADGLDRLGRRGAVGDVEAGDRGGAARRDTWAAVSSAASWREA
jgi:hypothetical protein